MRVEAPLLMNATQSIVMVDCVLNIDHLRLEAGWVAFRTGDYSPTVVMASPSSKIQCEIELPLNRRHFIQDVQQYSPTEAIYFRLTQDYLRQFKGNKLL